MSCPNCTYSTKDSSQTLPCEECKKQFDEDHAKMKQLPIVGQTDPCLICEEDYPWFVNRKLHRNGDDQIVFYEDKRGNNKEYILCEVIICMALCDGRKPEGHPDGVSALKRYVKVKCPADVQKHCFECLKKRNVH